MSVLGTRRLIVSAICQMVVATAAFAECEVRPPFCEAFWQYPAVFDGTVIHVEVRLVFLLVSR